MRTLLILAMLVAAAAAACGGDTLSVEAYFEDFTEARNAFLDGRTAVREDPDLLDALGDDDITRAERNLIQAGYEDVLAAADDFDAALDDLGAPKELADVHDDYVTLVADYRDAWTDAVEDAADIEARADLEDIGDEIGELDDRERILCEDLREIADDENVDADLECEPPQLDIEEYFAAVESLAVEADESTALFDELSERVEDADVFDEELSADLAGLLDDIASLFDDYGRGLAALNPPDETRDLNEDVAATYDELAAVIADAADEARRARSFEDLADVFVALDAPAEAADEACFALQQVAADSEVFVNLRCEAESVTAPASSLDAYFADVVTLADEFDFAVARTISIGGPALTATGPLNDEQRAALVQAFTVLRDGADDLRLALADLTPPDDAAFPHQQYIDTALESSRTATTAIELLRTAPTGDDRDRILDAVLVPACEPLAQVATDNGFVVDLACAQE